VISTVSPPATRRTYSLSLALQDFQADRAHGAQVASGSYLVNGNHQRDNDGVSFQQVQKYENGVNRVASRRLVRLAKILQVPVTALFEGIEDRRQPSALLAERTAYRLALAFAKLDEHPPVGRHAG
jgi:transcriptional regulator with XRE-family HTH domain